MTILFDLDGTLIDSTEAILESFHHSFDYFNTIAPSDDDIKALIGHPLDIMYSNLGVESSEVWNYVTIYKEHYKKISCQKTELLPFAKEAVASASKYAKLGIVTTKTGVYSRELMEHFGLMHYFETLIGREDVTQPKPNPEPILKALAALNVTQEDCWLIGDTLLDVNAAKAAKIECIAVTSGYDSESTLKKNCTFVFENALEAVLFIEKRTAK